MCLRDIIKIEDTAVKDNFTKIACGYKVFFQAEKGYYSIISVTKKGGCMSYKNDVWYVSESNKCITTRPRGMEYKRGFHCYKFIEDANYAMESLAKFYELSIGHIVPTLPIIVVRKVEVKHVYVTGYDDIYHGVNCDDEYTLTEAFACRSMKIIPE